MCGATLASGEGCEGSGSGEGIPGAGCWVRPSEPWKCLVIHIQFQRSVGLLVTRGGWGCEGCEGACRGTEGRSLSLPSAGLGEA